jgi:hypothetical protein
MPTMPYAKRIDRKHPGCLVFLLDQSASMEEPLPDRAGLTKAEGLANAVNELLLTIVRRCVKEPNFPPRHYYDIAIIGYGARVRTLLGGHLAGRKVASVGEIADAVIRTEERNGVRLPVWFDPVADGMTPMCEAFDLAGQVTAGWIRAHPHSFPPIIINITDGNPTDGDPTVWGQRLRSLHSADGNALLFNINMSANAAAPISFPSTPDYLADDYSRLLFGMSSELPDFMGRYALELGIPVTHGARGFVCNADMTTVIRALEVGTQLKHLEER